MLSSRECSGSNFFFISAECLTHLFTDLCELLDKFRLHVGIHGKHILIDKYLSVASGTGTDSESVLQPESLPEKYESGTLNLPGIAGLGAGCAGRFGPLRGQSGGPSVRAQLSPSGLQAGL